MRATAREAVWTVEFVLIFLASMIQVATSHPNELGWGTQHRLSDFEKDLFAIEDPDGNETEGAEGDRVCEGRPAGIGNVRDRAVGDPCEEIRPGIVRIADVNVVENAGHQFA